MTTAAKSQQVTTLVGLTHHNTNRSLLVNGPKIPVRPVAKRQVAAKLPDGTTGSAGCAVAEATARGMAP